MAPKTAEDVRIQSFKNLIPEDRDENPFKPDDPDFNMTVEEWGQREYDSGKKVGETQGRALVLKRIMDLAAVAFTDGKDDYALSLRALHKKLTEEGR
jgi:hypothetical protein